MLPPSEFASAGYGFSRTIVPVSLARDGKEKLILRSQSKRLLARFERFRVVILDFDGVDEIGQAFADEIFRVFPAEHPAVKIVPIKGSAAVKRMIRRARSNRMLPIDP